jgi:DNA-binding MarR family transcriptional regulator
MVYNTNLYSDNELSFRGKLVYLYLRDRGGAEKVAWPSTSRIASDLSISRSTVKRAIRDLEKAGYIRRETAYRENGSFTSNRYYLM